MQTIHQTTIRTKHQVMHQITTKTKMQTKTQIAMQTKMQAVIHQIKTQATHQATITKNKKGTNRFLFYVLDSVFSST